jgi:CCR4-NOT transcriptional regulation complex NOT5 subunit
MYQILCKTYLKSVMGQLIIQSQDRSMYSTRLELWPKQIKTMIQSTTMNKTIENEVCVAFVNNNLHELDKQLKQYEVELKIQITNFNGYTFTIQQTIGTYIKQNLLSLHMEIEHKIELVHYDYHIRALKLEYFRQNPNSYQVYILYK